MKIKISFFLNDFFVAFVLRCGLRVHFFTSQGSLRKHKRGYLKSHLSVIAREERPKQSVSKQVINFLDCFTAFAMTTYETASFFEHHPNDFFSYEPRHVGVFYDRYVYNYLREKLSIYFLCKIFLKCPILKFPLFYC